MKIMNEDNARQTCYDEVAALEPRLPQPILNHLKALVLVPEKHEKSMKINENQ